MDKRFEIRKKIVNENIIFESYSIDLDRITKSILFSKAMQNILDEDTFKNVIKDIENRLNSIPIGVNLKVASVKTSDGEISKKQFQFIMWQRLDKFED